MQADKASNMTTVLRDVYLKNQNLFILNDKVIKAREFIEQVIYRRDYLIQQKSVYWAICAEDVFWFCIDFFGVLLARKVPVLLPNNREGTLADLREHYDMALFDQDDQNLQTPERDGVFNELTDIDQLLLNAEANVVLFTSGSSGKPKKIIRTLSNFDNEISAIEKKFATFALDGIFYASVLPQHLYGLTFYILWPLLTGHIIATEKINYQEQLMPHLVDNKVVFISSPGLLSRFSTDGSFPVKELIVLSSGGHLKTSVADHLKNALADEILEIFGSSETGAIAYRRQFKKNLWQVFDGVKISQALSGALVVDSLFFNHAQSKKLITSDQVKLLNQQHFELLGRLDRVVKIESKRLSLEEMEQKLIQSKLVEGCYCLALETHRQLVAAVIVLSKRGKIELKTYNKRYINDQLRHHLSNYFDLVLIPKKFRYVEAIPMNHQSKIQLDRVKALFD
ncbi:AMP-binding protein [Thiotrichales bacterium 19S3-7]|nr:AMP-binding protein [Thiotrichales bacterium 19S3-7]MCF6802191.1 AMP-binding protein [Thiotrichales bacterium 19S3-11]